MKMRNPCRRRTSLLLAASFSVLLVACGGGGGGGPISTPAPEPTPTPSPVPTPAPTPSPTPTPASTFNTAEFRRSDGPGYHDAVAAWQQGIAGDGSIIAVIDSGIDADSPEFAGRIHPNSADVAGNRSVDGEDDHGTNVAMIAAAARDGNGILGIAWDAQVLALRADEPGSCGTDTPDDPSLGCLFNDRDIAAGVDRAIASGADVINLSLGGGAAGPILLDAIARAAAAGIVIVVSAGNGGDGSDPAAPPDEPDPFASSILQAGAGHVIIVGSIDENGQFSDFSNRAGSDAAAYLTARGESICCVYQNGSLYITTDAGGQQFVTLFSGTSFSAPQVAGAVALLAQAFPNLTGAEIVEILLDSARDAGAAGTDAVFGRGILDIAAAMAPAGTTTLAGTTTSVALLDDVVIGSTAMGDAPGKQGLRTVITDKYDRAYGYNLATRLRSAEVSPRLLGAVERQGRTLSGTTPAMSVAFTVVDQGQNAGRGMAAPLSLTREDAEKSRVLAARLAARIAPGVELGLAFRQGAGGMVAQLQGKGQALARPAFQIASGANGDDGFFSQADWALALRHQAGSVGITLSAEQGDAWLGSSRRAESLYYGLREKRPTHSFGLAVDRRLAGVEASLGITWMQESETVLGGYFHEVLGVNGADSAFLDLGARRDLGGGWQMGADWRQGITVPRGGSAMLADGSRLVSTAWSFDVARSGMFGPRDGVALRVSQPLRVSSGGLNLQLPVAYDYATESAIFGLQRFNLAPDGREVMGELAWRGPVWWGRGAASLFYRRDPGHRTDTPDDVGVVVRWDAEF